MDRYIAVDAASFGDLKQGQWSSLLQSAQRRINSATEGYVIIVLVVHRSASKIQKHQKGLQPEEDELHFNDTTSPDDFD